MTNKEIAVELCKTLGGFFRRDNVYIGGSLGLEMKFENFKQNENSDIDIFILTPRVETWALDHILQRLEDCDVYMTNDGVTNEVPDYRIRGQWKRYQAVAMPSNRKIDLIFIDGTINDLIQDTAADISKFYYTINYAPSQEEPRYILEDTHESSLANKHIVDGFCSVNVKQDNNKHIEKIKEKCALFGLKYVLLNKEMIKEPNLIGTKPRPPFQYDRISPPKPIQYTDPMAFTEDEWWSLENLRS